MASATTAEIRAASRDKASVDLPLGGGGTRRHDKSLLPARLAPIGHRPGNLEVRPGDPHAATRTLDRMPNAPARYGSNQR